MTEEATPEESPKPKYGILSSKEYDSMGLGPESQAITFFPDEGPEVFFKGKPSTPTRLHEMFHTTSAYVREHKTPEGFAYEELLANEYSKPGRKTLSYNFVFDVIGTMVRKGYKPAKIMSSITGALNKMGYYLSGKRRSELWWDIRDYYDSEKGKG